MQLHDIRLDHRGLAMQHGLLSPTGWNSRPKADVVDVVWPMLLWARHTVHCGLAVLLCAESKSHSSGAPLNAARGAPTYLSSASGPFAAFFCSFFIFSCTCSQPRAHSIRQGASLPLLPPPLPPPPGAIHLLHMSGHTLFWQNTHCWGIVL